MNDIEVLLALIGSWLIIDGAASIYMYRNQTLPEQGIRVVRVGIGAALIFLAAKS